MNDPQLIHANGLQELEIRVHEPFSKFLGGDVEEYDFSISLLDVVRFAGHACPSMVGAFLISQRAVKELFPETNICERGKVSIQMPGLVDQGATGPISNVFSMIFGAWEKSGFGGLQGQFKRRNLLTYGAPEVPAGVFRFTNTDTHHHVDIQYDPSKAKVSDDSDSLPFQKIWRERITKILKDPDQFVNIPQ